MTTTITLTLPFTLKDLRSIYRRKFNVPDHKKISKQMIAEWLGEVAEGEIINRSMETKKHCEFCDQPEAIKRDDLKGSPVLCDSCYEAYDNKTGYCSLDCCITGKCDESC